MNSSYCKHIRIRNGNKCEMNLERLIKSIEFEFNTDFTVIPNWKQILENIDRKKQKFESKIKNAVLRELFIINKIHEQQFRTSPFVLTKDLARTARLWKEIEASCRKRNDLPKTEIPMFCERKDDVLYEISDTKLTAHPNSEIFQSKDPAEPLIESTVVEVEIKSSLTHLPIVICTNPRKIISPLESQYSSIGKKTKPDLKVGLLQEGRDKNYILNNQTKCITCKPREIVIDNNILKKQVVQLNLTNVCTEALIIRFSYLSDVSSFKKATVYPKTPRKLYPGLSASYIFIFKLAPNINNINLFLHFRVGRNVLLGIPDEVFSVPVTEKPLERKIFVTETINIIPVYSWQINVKSEFPKSYLKISVCDNHNYYMYIRKREVDLSKEPNETQMSVDVIGNSTESVMQRMKDNKIEKQSELFSQSEKEELLEAVDSISNVELICLVLNDIVKLAMETFVFEKTFLFLPSYSKSKISVLFSKAEHEGYHQCYYDLQCYDASTNNVVITKTIKVFAEVLAHPVRIYPNILDMSQSPIKFGFREDRFVIKNTHKLYPVTLKIELTKKMRRLLQINPTEMTIPYSASESVIVRVCSKNSTNELTKGDLVHFTIKIILSGHESIYRRVPIMFYEIIVPCVTEFKKIYRIS